MTDSRVFTILAPLEFGTKKEKFLQVMTALQQQDPDQYSEFLSQVQTLYNDMLRKLIPYTAMINNLRQPYVNQDAGLTPESVAAWSLFKGEERYHDVDRLLKYLKDYKISSKEGLQDVLEKQQWLANVIPEIRPISKKDLIITTITAFANDLGQQILGPKGDQEYDAKLVQSLGSKMKEQYPEEFTALQKNTMGIMHDWVETYQTEMKESGRNLSQSVAWASVAAGLLTNCFQTKQITWPELMSCLRLKGATQRRFDLAHWLADFGFDTPLCSLPKADTLGHMKQMWDSKTPENVPIPTKDYSISPKLAETWINSPGLSLMDKKYRRQFVQEIVYISFREFLQLLRQSANSFLHQIQNEPYIVSLTVTLVGYEPYKSAEWLVSLCKVYIPDFPRPQDIAWDQNELIKYLKDIPETDKLCSLNVLFVDDISFSGQQLGSAISLVSSLLKHYSWVSINLHILVPIISVIAQKKVKDVVQRLQNNRFHVFLHTAKLVPKFSQDVIDRFQLESSKASALYSAHKLPDWLSVPNTMIAPLISNCEEYYIDQNGSPKAFNTTVPPCPWPPYKPETHWAAKKL